MPRERAAGVLREVQVAYPSAIRTAHLLERALFESWRRTKVIPHFFTEPACLKLVFSALRQTGQRWRRVTMTEMERQQLTLLRRELALPLYSGEESWRLVAHPH